MNINHILIQTTDLPAMAGFIENVAGLTIGDRPPFPFPGAWLYHQNKPVIHIVEATGNSAQADYLGSRAIGLGGVVDHIAFEGDDYSSLINRLLQHSIEYDERTVPLSQEHQIFAHGLEGLKIEILFDQNKAPLHFL